MDQIGRKQIPTTSGNIEQHINAGSANSMSLWKVGGEALADIPTLNPSRGIFAQECKAHTHAKRMAWKLVEPNINSQWYRAPHPIEKRGHRYLLGNHPIQKNRMDSSIFLPCF